MFSVERLPEQESEVSAAVSSTSGVQNELVRSGVYLVLVDSVTAGVWVGSRRYGNAARLRIHGLGDALTQSPLRELGSVVVHVQYLDLDLFTAAIAY